MPASNEKRPRFVDRERLSRKATIYRIGRSATVGDDPNDQVGAGVDLIDGAIGVAIIIAAAVAIMVAMLRRQGAGIGRDARTHGEPAIAAAIVAVVAVVPAAVAAVIVVAVITVRS
jgi:hypothetical protein